MKCQNCNYEWNYGGRLQRATCPNCGYKVVMKEKYDKYIKLGKALDNETRLEILSIIQKNPNINISDLSEKIGIAYNNVLANLKILEEAGLITRTKQLKSQGREVLLTPTEKLLSGLRFELLGSDLKKIKRDLPQGKHTLNEAINLTKQVKQNDDQKTD